MMTVTTPDKKQPMKTTAKRPTTGAKAAIMREAGWKTLAGRQSTAVEALLNLIKTIPFEFRSCETTLLIGKAKWTL
jgi:hypothetical protein